MSHVVETLAAFFHRLVDGLTAALVTDAGPNVPVLVVGAAVFMIAVEVRKPGRTWPAVSGWWARAALLNGIQAGVVYLAGVTWDPWLSAHRPWSADGLGVGWGALLGYLVITFVYYWWHRWRHEVPFLWRWLHQVHHSPTRLEVITSFYKHPFEIAVNSVLSAAILYGLVGLGPLASTWAVLLTGLAELFYHWNVRTPRWVGFIVQRPESHCVHHQHGVHAYNYADLPLWDMLFGTFRNPATFDDQCGLDGEERLGEMLLGHDLTPAEPISEATAETRPGLRWPVVLLLVLGLLRMAGDATGSQVLVGLGAASAASPAPKVFTVVGDMEPFANRFAVAWDDEEVQLTPALYARLEGPYNRRNAYGAVLAAAPALLDNPVTAPMCRSVLDHALAGDAPVLGELGLEPPADATVRVEYRHPSAPPTPLPPRSVEVHRSVDAARRATHIARSTS